VKMSQEVCESSGRGSAQSLSLLREGCLERKRIRFQSLTELMAAADATVVSRAIQAAEALPPVELCDDERALTAQVAPPEEPTVAAQIDGFQKKVDRLSVFASSGKAEAGLPQAQALLTEMKDIEFAPLKAQALFVTAGLHAELGQTEDAEAQGRKAVPLAARGGDAFTLANTWTLLTEVIGHRLGRLDEGVGMELAMQTVLAQAHDARSSGQALTTMGQVLGDAGKYTEAQERIERALAFREKTLGTQHVEVARSLTELGVVLTAAGKHEEAVTAYDRALTLWEKNVGVEHPEVALTRAHRSVSWGTLGHADEALAVAKQSLDALEKYHGPTHPRVALALIDYGRILLAQKNTTEAIPVLERALAQSSDTFAAPQQASLKFTLGQLQWDSGGDKKQAVKLTTEAKTFWQTQKHPREEEATQWLAAHQVK
jgi:tetratricopeptide (TPR) repeat protein